MFRIMAVALAIVVALAPASAQEVASIPAVPDLSAYMPRTEASATIATLNGQIASLQSAIPPTCGSAPAPDTVGGSPGIGQPCTPKADAARPARGQWTRATTDASCLITWNWSTSYSVPVLSVTTQDAGQPVLWSITAISATGATLRASRLRTLPASIAVVTALASFDVALGTCTGITAHIGVREQLVAQ